MCIRDRISNVRGGKIENGVAMPDKLNGSVTYRYTYDYTHEPLKAEITFTPSVWFTDVNVYSTPHAVDIQWLADNKITTGWLVNGCYVFRGMDNVKRRDMAAFLHRLAAKAGKGTNVTPKNNFKDCLLYTSVRDAQGRHQRAYAASGRRRH